MSVEKKRKITVITGTRADFGILTPVMKAIQKHPNLELSIIATAMHLSPKFGNTINEVEKTFQKVQIEKVHITLDNSGKTSAIGSGEATIGISRALTKLNPNIVLVLGDRIEMMAASISTMEKGIVLAHIHGGDKTKGGFDENRRHAITKLANIHFPATPQAKERIKKLGEPEKNIYYVGSPSLDTILKIDLLKKEKLFEKYNLDKNKQTAILIQHPVSTEPEKSKEQINITINALKESNLQVLAIYPNSDPGHKEIIEEIEKSNFPNYKSLQHKDYLSLLKHSDILIGNSSSGMIDCSAYPIAVINIGIRQAGREHGINVIHCNHNKKEIKKAIEKALSKEYKLKISNPKSPYGDGTASEKIAEILATIEIDHNLLQKQITY